MDTNIVQQINLWSALLIFNIVFNAKSHFESEIV